MKKLFHKKKGGCCFLFILVTIIVLLDVVPFCQHALVILYFHLAPPLSRFRPQQHEEGHPPLFSTATAARGGVTPSLPFSTPTAWPPSPLLFSTATAGGVMLASISAPMMPPFPSISTRVFLPHHTHLNFSARRRNDGPSTSVPLDIDTRKRDCPSSTTSTSILLPGGGVTPPLGCSQFWH